MASQFSKFDFRRLIKLAGSLNTEDVAQLRYFNFVGTCCPLL